MMPCPFDPLIISERLQAWLARSSAAGIDGESWHRRSDGSELIAAAVLVPIIRHASGPTVLFTQRSSHLSDHPGQISFPGGRVEPEDCNREETALRETEEEIGLDRQHVTVLGCLPEYITGTGFCVTPVVGCLESGFSLVLDSFEVAEVFEVPLAFLLNPANHRQEKMIWEGRERQYYAMPYQGRYIWGATAGMVHSLHLALAEPEKETLNE